MLGALGMEYGGPVTHGPLVQRLEEVGYAVRFRHQGWVEVLVLGFGEVWVGHGNHESEAIQHAVRQMCPSRLAEQGLARPASAPIEPERVFVALARPEAGSAPTREDAADRLQILTERMVHLRPELALSSAERQRLAMLAWICEARSYAERFPEDAVIRDGVTAISRHLTDIGKAYWPGSVTALQLQITPKDLPRPMLGGVPHSWSEAADLAERSLWALEAPPHGSHKDPFGYADSDALHPPPADPRGLMKQVVQEVEAATGRLERGAEPERGMPAGPNPEVFARWVRTVRWLRRSTDPELWARALGRLRWWGARKGGPSTLELDPDHAPERPWAQLLDAPADAGQVPDLESELRARWSGRRLLFVGVRRDPELQQRLQVPDLEIHWHLAGSDTASELEAEIKSGRFDTVVGALGLQNRNADQKLALACRVRAVPYWRTHFNEPRRVLEGLVRAGRQVPGS